MANDGAHDISGNEKSHIARFWRVGGNLETDLRHQNDLNPGVPSVENRLRQ